MCRSPKWILSRSRSISGPARRAQKAGGYKLCRRGKISISRRSQIGRQKIDLPPNSLGLGNTAGQRLAKDLQGREGSLVAAGAGQILSAGELDRCGTATCRLRGGFELVQMN